MVQSINMKQCRINLYLFLKTVYFKNCDHIFLSVNKRGTLMRGFIIIIFLSIVFIENLNLKLRFFYNI